MVAAGGVGATVAARAAGIRTDAVAVRLLGHPREGAATRRRGHPVARRLGHRPLPSVAAPSLASPEAVVRRPALTAASSRTASAAGGPGRAGGGGGGGGQGSGRGRGEPPPTDPSRISIDLNQIRREMFEELVPDRAAFEQLPPEERDRITTQIDQRMRGIAQGIEVLKQELAARVAASQAEEAAAAATAGAAGPAAGPAPPANGAPASAAGSSAPPAPSATSAPAPPRPAAPAAPAPPAVAGTQRTMALSGSRLAVKVERGGEVVGQVDADVDLPKLLEAVFSKTVRARGELPFAVAQDGQLFTPTLVDKARLEALNTPAVRPGTVPGTTVVRDWIIATTPDPTGSGLTFGIARPVDAALRDLVRSAARDVGIGLAFIVVALIGIVPLSGRLTRNLASLSEGVHRIAQGDYGARVDVHANDEVGRLAKAFNKMAADVEVHQRSIVGQERLRRELELGRQIQHDMLPQAPLRLGLTEIKGVSVPAREVGGDFFNYFQLANGTVALLVGDVSGKGVGAALLMANIQASLRTRLALGQDLASLANELDRDIEGSTPGPVYATLFVGIFDPVTRVLRCVNAGHNPQYVLRQHGDLERMESTGLPIGLLAGHGYVEQHFQLAAGDVLFFYTDGCVEAENAAGDMFGPERLEKILRQSAGAEDVLLSVETDVARFRAGVELNDDATMMVVRVG